MVSTLHVLTLAPSSKSNDASAFHTFIHPQILQNTPPTLTCQYLGGDMLIAGRDTFHHMLEGSSTQQNASWDGICDSSQEGIWYHYSHHYYPPNLFQYNMYADNCRYAYAKVHLAGQVKLKFAKLDLVFKAFPTVWGIPVIWWFALM